MEADNEVLQRKTRETEAMRQRVVEMDEVRRMMEKQVKDYTIYEVKGKIYEIRYYRLDILIRCNG